MIQQDDVIYDLSLEFIEIIDDNYIGEYLLLDKNISLNNILIKYGSVKKELLKHFKEKKYSYFICRKYNKF